MKRFLILCIAIIGLSLGSMAKPVGFEAAKAVATKFMGTEALQLSATYRTGSNVAAFYVFNTTDGFVIVAADDCETPIIAYSYEGRFDPNNIPVQMEDYLQDYVFRIQYGIESHVEANEITAQQWNLVKSTGRLSDSKAMKTIGPLLTDKWHQGCLYNSLCPSFSKVPCGHAEVGCVAVAMGQIMHYWKYPAKGWGSHSYTNSGVTLSADFGSTSYDWDHMPDSLTENSSEAEIEAVATLLYHCGVSVDMYYTSNGSGANSSDVPNALYRYFDYSKFSHREKQSDYNDEEWLSLLKHDLDLLRPVLYSGKGEHVGHAFVCDGYDENDMLHFNWGWGVANGYFALGNLNPNGNTFNDNNYAIFDIIPHYDPCMVTATAYPASAGTVEGIGEYHVGEQCILTATPTEDYRFYCWKKDGQVISNLPTITIAVEEDTLKVEAIFCLPPVSQITASHAPDESNQNSPNVSLSWGHDDEEWQLLKQFDIHGETGGVATDGEHIYVSYAAWNSPPYMFDKYNMDGTLVESFNLEGLTDALCLAYDGNSYYCNSMNSTNALSTLFRIDLDHKTVLESIDMDTWFGTLTYDLENDGFWLGHDYQVMLYNRQGQRIKTSPTTPDYIDGAGYFTAKDGSPHLLLVRDSGVYNYDITNDHIIDFPMMPISDTESVGFGACTGKYDGKDALFFSIGSTLCIYEIKSTLAQIKQIIGYRIYRADSDGNTIMLADEFNGSTYLDTTWNNVIAGTYRFGISEVFANGNESEILWSNTIVKTDYGINENNEWQEPSSSMNVQKIIENGQIIIIKDGKHYNVSGQELN